MMSTKVVDDKKYSDSHTVNLDNDDNNEIRQNLLPSGNSSCDGNQIVQSDFVDDVDLSRRRPVGSSGHPDLDIERCNSTGSDSSFNYSTKCPSLSPEPPTTLTEAAAYRRIPSYLRWVVLVLGCLLMLGNYYCYDIPGALTTQLQHHLNLPYNEWQVKMNSFYTAYSAPNLVMPLVGGLLIDSLGSTRMLLSFALVTVFGQLLFTLGTFYKLYWLMVLGRCIFGIGGESLEVAQVRITTEWFSGSFLGLALGLNHTSSGIITALNDIISPLLPDPVWAGSFGALMCGISLLAAITLKLIHKYSKSLELQSSQDEAVKIQDEDDSHVSDADFVDPDAFSSDSFLESSDSERDDDNDETKSLLSSSDDPAKIERKSKRSRNNVGWFTKLRQMLPFNEIRRLPFSFWLVCLASMALYGAVNPFIHILSDLLQKRWFPDDPRHASALMSIPDFIAAIGSPLCGYIVDRISINKRHKNLKSILLPLAGILLAFIHYLISFTDVSPVLPLVLLGMAYSLFGSSLWPLIPHFVQDKHILGAAYGASAISLNISLTVGPQIVSHLLTNWGYSYVGTYFIMLSILGTAISLCITYMDTYHARKENNSSQQPIRAQH